MIIKSTYQSFNMIYGLFKRLKSLQNFIYPYACLACSDYLQDLSGLCGDCAKKLNYIVNKINYKIKKKVKK